jgi:protein-tyrosine phosphatase
MSATSDETGSTPPFTFLFVCTGNIHRSVTAERLFDASVRPGSLAIARSAGVRAVVGHGVADTSAQALIQLGANPSGHHAVRLTTTLVDEANLILTADTSQRSYILQRYPKRLSTTFTLLEFVRLAAGVKPLGRVGRRGAAPDFDEAQHHVANISSERISSTSALASDEIHDPVRQSVDTAYKCALQIQTCVSSILSTFGILRDQVDPD